jgi:hypothetical protein
MKRTALLSSLILMVALSAAAADRPAASSRPPVRLAVLSLPERYAGSEDRMTLAMRGLLRDELRDAGYDAITTPATYDDLKRHAESNADYYVEVVYVDAAGRPLLGVDASTRVGDVRVSGHITIVKTAASVDVRVYDGQSLELVDQYRVDKTRVATMLSDVSLSTRHLPLYLAVSLFNHMQRNSAVRAVAHDAASRIDVARLNADRP